MYSITKVCQNCDNNRFTIRTNGAKFTALCSKCSTEAVEIRIENLMIVPACKNCNCKVFRVQMSLKEENKEDYIFTCSSCVKPADFILIDEEGNQITKEQKELLEIKKTLKHVIIKIDSMGSNIKELRIHAENYDINGDDTLNLFEEISSNIYTSKENLDSILVSIDNLKDRINIMHNN
jgi:superfamily II DNA helicase RecQ